MKRDESKLQEMGYICILKAIFFTRKLVEITD